jgi:hypothetical protein
MKYLRINLMKKTKDLSNESYKPLKRETEDGKTFHVCGLVG